MDEPTLEVAEIEPGLWVWGVRSGDDWCGSVYLEPGSPGEGGPVLVEPVLPAEGTEDRARFFRALDRDVARVAGPCRVLHGGRPAPVGCDRDAPGVIASRYPGAIVREIGPDPERGAETGTTEVVAVPTGEPGAEEVAYHLPRRGVLVMPGAVRGRVGGRVEFVPGAVAGTSVRNFREVWLALAFDRVVPLRGNGIVVATRDAFVEALGRGS